MLGRIKRVLQSMAKAAGAGKAKSWESAQKFELDHAIGFMQQDFFRELHRDTVSGKLKISTGYVNELMLKEFFGGDLAAWKGFTAFIGGKACLDVGPCVYSPLACWDTASQRYGIEPLFEAVDRWQKANLGHSAFDGMKVFTEPAEQTIPELVGRIDGAIVCRNMLDHSPHWPFTLVNISRYARPGCKLLFWTDLVHSDVELNEGHFDITSDLGSFKNLIEMMGFKVIQEYSDAAPGRELNWGCYAEKT